MDLLTALKILLRRWPVVLAGLVFTVFAVIQVGQVVKPTYEAKATVLFKSPGAANPFLEFPQGLEVTADALIVVLQSPVGGKQLEAAGATANYSLERTNGPIVEITADGATAESADDTVDLVVEALKKQLQDYQTTAPADQVITVDAITEPTSQAKYGSRIRAQFAVGAIGLAATVAAGLAVDALMRQRQESKLRRQALAEAEAEAARDDDWYPSSHAARPPAMDEPRRAPAANGTHNGAPSVPVLNGGTVNGRSSVYRPKPSRSRSEVPADGPPQPGPVPAGAKPVATATKPAATAAKPAVTAAPQSPATPPAPPAGARQPGERSLTDRLATDLSAAGRPAPDGLAERPPLARRPSGPPPGPAPARPAADGARQPAGAQPSRPAGDVRPPASPQPSRPGPAAEARPPAAAPAGDPRQPKDGKAAEAPRANLP
jgi:hypothetical protein